MHGEWCNKMTWCKLRSALAGGQGGERMAANGDASDWLPSVMQSPQSLVAQKALQLPVNSMSGDVDNTVQHLQNPEAR